MRTEISCTAPFRKILSNEWCSTK